MDSGVTLLPNERDLLRRYGLSLDQYVELLEAQGGVCAVCGKPPTERSGPLVVDHNHDTLTIDGLVHSSPCNRRLLQQVRRYLANPPGRQFGWTVPAELEAKTIARREAGKVEARERRAAAAEAKRAAEARRRAMASGAARLHEMTRPDPDADGDRVDEELTAAAGFPAAGNPAPAGNPEPEPPPPTLGDRIRERLSAIYR